MRPFQYLAPFPSFDYVVPDTLQQLFEELDGLDQGYAIIAGGTDIMLALKERTVTPKAVVDVSRLRSDLGGIRMGDGMLHIGALATFSEIESNPMVERYAKSLTIAAANVGTLQIRNLATLGGNLGTASPAADSGPPLIALGARLILLSKSGERTLPVEAFFTGPKRNSLQRGEIVSEVQVPVRKGIWSSWSRGAVRKENVLSTVSVAVAATTHDGKFGESRVALGAVAPTPILAVNSSKAMTGSEATAEQADRIASLAEGESKPISDIRASAHYRKHLVFVLTRRLILEAIAEASGR